MSELAHILSCSRWFKSDPRSLSSSEILVSLGSMRRGGREKQDEGLGEGGSRRRGSGRMRRDASGAGQPTPDDGLVLLGKSLDPPFLGGQREKEIVVGLLA